jgi:alpha-1,6-mannosyltransferase
MRVVSTTMPDERNVRLHGLWLLVACAVLVELCWLGVLGLGDLRGHLVIFLGLFGIAFVAYLGAAWLALAGHARVPLTLILGAAALFRLTLLFAAPTLSDDLYRSVWEGRVLLAGLSPYRYPPDAEVLTPLRDAIWEGVNNKSVASPYPPLAQLYSVGAALISPAGVFGPKLLSTLLDCGVIAALLWWLRRSGQPDERLILYAWAPLPGLEFAHSGHNDALMVLLLVLALALSRRPVGGPLALAAAALAKIVPLLLAPILVRWWGLRGAGLVVGLLAIGYAPLVLLGGGAVGSLPVYAATWSDNDSLFFLLRALFSPFAADPTVPAKLASLGLLGLGILLLAFHPTARRLTLNERVLAALGLFLALSSTVHAWYLIWLLPLLAFVLDADARPLVFRPLWAYAWLLLSGLVVLPYLTYADHQWQAWISVAQYGPVYAVLALGCWNPVRAR